MSYFKNKNIWFWGFMILLLVNISVIGSMSYVMYRMHNQENYTGFHHKMMRNERHPRHNTNTQSLIKKLHLNKVQEQDLKTIRMHHMKKMRALKKALMVAQHQLFEEAGKNEIDSSLLNKYRTKMMNLQGKIADESVSFLGELKEHLSPEQQQLLKQHFREKYSKMSNTHIK